MAVDLTIIFVLDSENEIDAASFELILPETEIACANLEAMQQVLWNLS